MTPAEHYLQAERHLLGWTQMSQDAAVEWGAQTLALAQVHATLATVSHATYNDALEFAAYAQRQAT